VSAFTISKPFRLSVRRSALPDLSQCGWELSTSPPLSLVHPSRASERYHPYWQLLPSTRPPPSTRPSLRRGQKIPANQGVRRQYWRVETRDMEPDNTHDMDDAAVLPDTGTSGKKRVFESFLEPSLSMYLSEMPRVAARGQPMHHVSEAVFRVSWSRPSLCSPLLQCES
jgi:hypothetical protein